MNNDLAGKRLLYLGGISRARYVIERIRQLGVYTIVADYNEDSPAKAVADEGVLVDAMDVDALERIGREKRIDGVLTGYCDILLPVCKELSRRLGTPCYFTDTMLKMTTDKDFFKAECERFSVPVPKKFQIDSEDLQGSASRLSYPVFIKPIDASGSRGACACYSKEEFVEKYNFALSHSKKKIVTVEEKLHGVEFILDYTIIDGTAQLVSMEDTYSLPGRAAAVNSPNIMIFPSKFLDVYMKTVDPCVRKMLEQEGFCNGSFFFQGFSNNRKIAFYESGCRLGGLYPYIMEYYNGRNTIDMLARHALTGKMLLAQDKRHFSPYYRGKAGIIYFLSSRPSGRIAKIRGVDELRKLTFVVHFMQYYFEGDGFDSSRQTDVRFLAVHLVADTFDELKKRMKAIYALVDVSDEKGNSLLMPPYDVDALTGYEGRMEEQK